MNSIYRNVQEKCKGKSRKIVDSFEKVFITILAELYKAKFDFNNSEQILSTLLFFEILFI